MTGGVTDLKKMLFSALKKLKDRRGASMIMALMLLAACAALGMSALGAARTGVGRYGYLNDFRRDRLSVESAAELIKSQLCGFEMTSEYVYGPRYELSPEEALEGGGASFGMIADADIIPTYSFSGDGVCSLISGGLEEILERRFLESELGGRGWLGLDGLGLLTAETVYEISVEVPSDSAFAVVFGEISLFEDRITVSLKSEDGFCGLAFEAPIVYGVAEFECEEEYLCAGDPLSVSRLKEGRAEFSLSVGEGTAAVFGKEPDGDE